MPLVEESPAGPSTGPRLSLESGLDAKRRVGLLALPAVGMAAADNLGLPPVNALMSTAKRANSVAIRRMVEKVRGEVEGLERRAGVALKGVAKVVGQDLKGSSKFVNRVAEGSKEVTTSCKLDTVDGSLSLVVESGGFLDTVTVRSDVKVDIDDPAIGGGATAARPGGILSVMECDDEEIRPAEGKTTTLTVYVLTSSSECEVTVLTLKSLSLHERVSDVGDETLLSNELTMSGDLSLAEIHSWVNQCFDGLPERPPVVTDAREVKYLFRSAALGTKVLCRLMKGKLIVHSDSILTMTHIREGMATLATQRRRVVDLNVRVDNVTVDRLLATLLETPARFAMLVRETMLAEAVREVLAFNGGDMGCVDEYLTGCMERDDKGRREMTVVEAKLEQVYRAVDVRDKVPILMQLLRDRQDIAIATGNGEGQNQSGMPGGPPGGDGAGDAEKQKKQKKQWEPPLPTRVGKKKKKGPDAAHKLPPVFPTTRCKLKLLKNERIKDYLLLEEEFVQNQERLKPQEEKNQEERTRVDELRGSPMNVGTLEEIIDDDHAIVSASSGSEYYVSIMSYVDKDLLEPSCSVLLHHKNLSIVGVLQDDADPMVSVMKLEKAPTESYADVGGLDQQIQEIKEAVELPLTHPELYEEMGIKPPKGVILYGPPGTGKTLLAKAVANQTSATFLRVVGSELIQKYLGDGPKLVRELFRVAEENAPSIVFIDEIDAIGTKRYDSTSGGEREIQRTMLELLNQLDGFDSRGDVKVIMATNRIDSLDPALIRPGRIDRKIEFPLPDMKTKRRIFNIHTGRMTLGDDVDVEEFVTAKDDLSGADVKAICTEAGLLALRERRMKVVAEDFKKAKEKVLYRKNEGTPEGLYL
ncbi:ATPase of 26S proteasome regulatory subunit 4 [Irineochytrium annulatum]|nr:ATPase of 26S proteasome regulatory subunit 4 [Irineochytrium annulatum]